ncbi:glyoxal oxidase [Paraconexibacter algicola]|uniref:Galactose oxidase-like Early set domain-containing protein n=1 Tax=Paraconexibacter algicola TaxID=2133960 RepID=A0A2T4UJQ6_9ACTN|nr:glyoxal oxidase [Paraconexibacter algicola]PTL59469.1 hypothetical protein C7Y72_07305 [Paraconexibacter algicola]
MGARFRGLALTGLVACTIPVLGMAAAPASAHGPRVENPGLYTRTLDAQGRVQLAVETSILGREHALQHLAQRQAVLPPAPDGDPGFDPCRPRGAANQFEERPRPPLGRPTGQQRCSTLPRQPRTKAALGRLGRWSADTSDLPHYAIHATLMPTGKVLFWGFDWTQHIITANPTSHQQTSGAATIWDPAKGTGPSAFKPVPPPLIDVDGDGVQERVPLYCSGQLLLADGRVLVTGGTLDLRWFQKGYTNPPGLKIVLIFDPRTETWARSQDMTVPRWYPTQVKLADGRVAVLGGFDANKPTSFTQTLDIISADGRTVAHAPSGDRLTWTYPGMLLMPSSRVLLAGPIKGDVGLLDPRTLTWKATSPLPADRGGGNLVPVPSRTGASPEAMLIGGADFLAPSRTGQDQPAYRTTVTFDERRSARGFEPSPSQHRGRNWPNTVLLPDGSMVTLGGGTGITKRDAAFTADPKNRAVELWDPRTKRWRLGPSQREDRTYHSVGVLLPDGRVWSAGDDANPNRDGDTAELYEPPYLFRGERPRIVAGPRRVGARRSFTLTVTGPAPERVTMLAPSATTHALDMNQRFVELRVLRRRTVGTRTVLTVQGPRRPSVAPPGPWMLFALSEDGAPSVARWTTVR